MATVSSENTETTLQLYTNPVLVQNKLLDMFEKHVFDNKQVLDGNNVLTFLLEMQSTLAAGITNEMTNTFRSLYPSRAEKSSDLYKHMSDYDYVGLFSSPSQTSVELIMGRDFLINNAPVHPTLSGYQQVIIPSFSTFKIGDYTFGIHYPINIRIKKGKTYDDTMFHITWDATKVNPLYSLNSNILEHRIYSRDGLNLLCISIPIHQFVVNTYPSDIIPSTGFIKRYQYSNKFYACRIFRNNTHTNMWEELSTTLSDYIYDPENPTAKLKVLTDTNTLEVSIPQVYITGGLKYSNKILTMIYTTEGELNVDIKNFSTDQFSASFLINDKVENDAYSKILKRTPLLQLVPLTTKISGGSNGYTFEQLRNKILYNVSNNLLITQNDIASHLSLLGFKTDRYIDNITDRIYVARRAIKNTNGDIIASGDYKTTLASTLLKNNEYNEIRKIDVQDGVKEYIILPSSIFKYDHGSDCMIPLTKEETKKLSTLPLAERITELNTNTYTYTPFHVKLSTDPAKPIAGTYDLLKPTISNVAFSGENSIPIQISMFSSTIQHLENGTDGYRLAISLYKSAGIEDINTVVPSANAKGLTYNIAVALITKNTSGSDVYMLGTFNKKYNGKDIIVFDLPTDYFIVKDNIDINSFTSTSKEIDPDTTYKHYVKLNQEYELRFYIAADVIPEKLLMDNEGNSLNVWGYNKLSQPESVKDMVWLSSQKLNIKLGESVSTLLNNVSITMSNIKYKGWPCAEYAIYGNDIYSRSIQNGIKITNTTPQTSIIAQLNNVYQLNGTEQIYVNNTTLDSGSWYERLVDNGVVSWRIMTTTPTVRVEYDNGALRYSTLNGGIDLEIEHKKGDVILSSTTDNPLRSPCFNIKETTDTDIEINKLYLEAPYTNLPAITNKWDKHPDVSRLGTTSKYRVVLEDLVDLISKLNTTTYIDNGIEKTITFDDMVCNIVLDPVSKKYIINDKLKNKYFVYLDDASVDTLTTSRVEAIINPISGELNRFSLSEQEDMLVPEHTFYRRDIEVCNFDYTSYITTQMLGYLWQDVEDNFGLVTKVIAEKYNVTLDIANKLWKLRCPWKKAIAISISVDETLSAQEILQEYWNNRYIINIKYSLLKQLQNYVSNNSINKYNNVTLPTITSTMAEDQIVWCDDISVIIANEKLVPDPLLGDLLVPLGQPQGALLKKHIKQSEADTYVWEAILTGPNIDICKYHLLSYNTYSGFAYVCYDTTKTGIDNSITFIELPMSSRKEIVSSNNEITYDYKIGYDVDTCAWDYVYSWPWELEDWTTICGKYIDRANIEFSINRTDTDAILLHEKNDIILNEYGKAVEDDESVTTERKTVYRVNMPHIDYKLTLSQEPQYTLFRQDVSELMREYFSTLTEVSKRKLEKTELYFSPIKTIGYGKFKDGNGIVTNRDLSITISLKLHAGVLIDKDSNNKTAVENNILNIVEKHLESGVLSATKLADTIRTSLSDYVQYVDVLGINDDITLQTLIPDNKEYIPHLKTELVIKSDGTVGTKKGLNIIWSIIR